MIISTTPDFSQVCTYVASAWLLIAYGDWGGVEGWADVRNMADLPA